MVLVKNKKKATASSSLQSGKKEKEVLDIFRRNFEAQFGTIQGGSVNEDSSDDSDEDSSRVSGLNSDSESNNSAFDDSDDLQGDGFKGFSEDDDMSEEDDDDAPQVVKFTDTSAGNRGLDLNAKQEKKKFMVSNE